MILIIRQILQKYKNVGKKFFLELLNCDIYFPSDHSKRFKSAIVWDRHYSYFTNKKIENSKEGSLCFLGIPPSPFHEAHSSLRQDCHSGNLWWTHSCWKGTCKESLPGRSIPTHINTWNRGARSYHWGLHGQVGKYRPHENRLEACAWKQASWQGSPPCQSHLSIPVRTWTNPDTPNSSAKWLHKLK